MKADIRTVAPQDRWRARKFASSYARLLTGERETPTPPKFKRKSKQKPRQGVLPLADQRGNRP